MVTKGQISDGTISQKHVLRSTIYVESLMGLYKMCTILIVALYYIVHHAVVVVHCVLYVICMY